MKIDAITMVLVVCVVVLCAALQCTCKCSLLDVESAALEITDFHPKLLIFSFQITDFGFRGWQLCKLHVAK